jgi:hypothetical protein
MTLTGNGNCAEEWQDVVGNLLVYSKEDSSAECQSLVRLVRAAFTGRRLVGPSMTSLDLRLSQAIYPYREMEVWRADVGFATTVMPT